MIRTNLTLTESLRGMARASNLITSESRKRPEHFRTNQCEDVCLNCIKDDCNGNCAMIRKAKKGKGNGNKDRN